MKKNILIIVSLLIMIVALVGCTGVPMLGADSKANNVSSEAALNINAYDILEEFVTDFPNRTSGYTTVDAGVSTDDSKLAAEWISSQFVDMGYDSAYAAQGGLKQFSYKNPITKRTEVGYNVIYTKYSKTKTFDTVVIGAHYDNVSNISVNNVMIGGDGTYSNGTGVVAMLELARVLTVVDLPYNVEFVAFAAKESGSFGSQNYVDSVSKDIKDNMLLMVNFDRVAGGDNVYMYSSEAATDHNKFFYNAASEKSLEIEKLPPFLNPKTTSYFYGEIMYNHEAMNSDSNTFLNSDINIINMISTNFSKTVNGVVIEREGMDNIGYTPNDTFENFVKRLGGGDVAINAINSQIGSVVSVVYHSMLSEDFTKVMKESKPNAGLDLMMNSKMMNVIAYSILGGIILILVVVYFALRDKTKTHPVFIDTPMGRMEAATGKITPHNYTANTKDLSEKIDVFGDDGKDDKVEENKEENNDIFGEF